MEILVWGTSRFNPRLGFPAMLNYFVAVPWKKAVPPGLCVLQEYPLIPACFQFPCLRGQRTIYDFLEPRSLGRSGPIWPSSSDRFWPRSSLALLWIVAQVCINLSLGTKRLKRAWCSWMAHWCGLCSSIVFERLSILCTDLYVLWHQACSEVALCL